PAAGGPCPSDEPRPAIRRDTSRTMRRNDVPVRRLPRESVIDAALASELPAAGLAARNFDGKAWKVELLSPWGWQTPYPQKVDKARGIADRLEAAGLCCAFDVLVTGGFDVVFELQ